VMSKLHLFRRSGVVLLFLLLPATVLSEGQRDLDAGLQLFRENKVKEALPLFQRAVARDEGNAEALAWLAEAYRRLGHTREALETASQSLELQPRNSFAHVVMAEALLPDDGNEAQYDTVWVHVEQAVACDSTDGNAWQMMWAREVFAGDVGRFQKVLRKMVETGFLTEAALAYGRWELRCLPEQAVLITNGDMDTFPAEAVQVTERFRPDVAVVERGLLNTPSGRRFVREGLDVQIPYEDADLDSLVGVTNDGRLRTAADHILRGWTDPRTRGAFARPLTFAPTVEESYYEDYEDHLVNAGAFLLWQVEPPSAAVDTATIRLSLSVIKPGSFRGPWVGEEDRSPIRRVYTKYLAKNVTWSAITYAQELMSAGRVREADDVLTWADAFEQDTELGAAFTEDIEELRATLHRRDTSDGQLRRE
jgi:tetratricopeptide (TPR) repeat protein